MNKYFNKSMYLEAFRQLKAIGILSLLIYVIEAVFSAYNKHTYGYPSYYDNYKNLTKTYYLFEMHGILFATIYIVTPVLFLVLFGFLNKRNSSDFYHAIPVKRTALALSMIAAIMSWIVIIVVGSTLVSALGASMSPYFMLDTASAIISPLYIIIGCFAVCCGMLIAVSISGNYFSNIMISAIIFFFPRIIYLYYLSMAYELTNIVPSIDDTIWTNASYNIVFGSFISLINIYDFDFSKHLISIVYTLVLAIIYLLIGLIVFKKRNSETATKAASNVFLQAIIRIVPAFLITLFPIAIICDTIVNQNSLDIFSVLLCYSIAIFAYFLYELISTKHLSNVLKSIKGLWVLVIANIILIIAISCGATSIYSYIPQKENIEYVEFQSMYDKKNIIQCDNDAFIDTSIEHLKSTISNYRLRHVNQKFVYIQFHEKNKIINRKLYLSSAEYDYYISWLEQLTGKTYKKY